MIKRPAPSGLLLGCLLALLLGGCATAPKHSRGDVERVLSERSLRFATAGQIVLRGRVGFSDGKQAGSGEITWHQGADDDRIELSVPLAQRRYLLKSDPLSASLNDGRSERVAADADSLLIPIFGFAVPLAKLRHWSRATAAEGAHAGLLNAENAPASLTQNGWQIDYRDYRLVGETLLPHKIVARFGDHSVRLSVAEWQFLD